MALARDLLLGARIYLRGFRAWRRQPGPMWVALLPGLVTAWLFAAGLVALFAFLPGLSGGVAGCWVGDGAWHDLIQLVVALALLGGALAFCVLAFVSVTSTIGQPAYEWVSHTVDDSYGAVQEGAGERWWNAAGRAVREGLTMLFLGVGISLAVAVVGFLPVVGAALAWILGATLGGWVLAIEFTSPAFERRGLTLRDRRAALRARRGVAVGFGVLAFAASTVAPLAVLTMPVSYAGGAHLARWALGESAQG